MSKENDELSRAIEDALVSFRQIEHLFDVMSAADSDVQGVFIRRWAEIGVYLADILHKNLDKVALCSRKAHGEKADR